MRTVVESHLNEAQQRKSRTYDNLRPTNLSYRELGKHGKKGKKRSIQEVLEILRRSEDFGEECEVNYEHVHSQVWRNTNKLLQNDRNYVGIKTGITKNAGCCLSSQRKKKDATFTCSKSMDWLTLSFARYVFH
jgi:hypothetical protein